ncbi:MAG: hypothetical protein JSV84_02080 [Gemmatimonadota bacterium]|nr:MAG: hypothetical protein JSV84_02080 [Gemmatimonadota bacterium]
MKKSMRIPLFIIRGLSVLIILGVLLTKLAAIIVGPDTFEERLARDMKGAVKDSLRFAKKLKKVFKRMEWVVSRRYVSVCGIFLIFGQVQGNIPQG